MNIFICHHSVTKFTYASSNSFIYVYMHHSISQART